MTRAGAMHSGQCRMLEGNVISRQIMIKKILDHPPLEWFL